MQVGELNATFSQVIEQARKGGRIIISVGRKKENVAVQIDALIVFQDAKATDELGSLCYSMSFR